MTFEEYENEARRTMTRAKGEELAAGLHLAVMGLGLAGESGAQDGVTRRGLVGEVELVGRVVDVGTAGRDGEDAAGRYRGTGQRRGANVAVDPGRGKLGQADRIEGPGAQDSPGVGRDR